MSSCVLSTCFPNIAMLLHLSASSLGHHHGEHNSVVYQSVVAIHFHNSCGDMSLFAWCLPSIGNWGRMKQCSIQSKQSLLAPSFPDSLLNCLVLFGREVWRLGNVRDTHCVNDIPGTNLQYQRDDMGTIKRAMNSEPRMTLPLSIRGRERCNIGNVSDCGDEEGESHLCCACFAYIVLTYR